MSEHNEMKELLPAPVIPITAMITSSALGSILAFPINAKVLSSLPWLDTVEEKVIRHSQAGRSVGDIGPLAATCFSHLLDLETGEGHEYLFTTYTDSSGSLRLWIDKVRSANLFLGLGGQVRDGRAVD